MAKMVGARVYNSANISISNGVLTALTFDSEDYDLDTIHSTATNTGRLTCQTAGKYLIGVCIRFAANATGIRQVWLKLNGTTYFAVDARSAASSGATVVAFSHPQNLAATDYVEVEVNQTSGGALNVEASSAYSPYFWMHRVN